MRATILERSELHGRAGAVHPDSHDCGCHRAGGGSPAHAELNRAIVCGSFSVSMERKRGTQKVSGTLNRDFGPKLVPDTFSFSKLSRRLVGTHSAKGAAHYISEKSLQCVAAEEGSVSTMATRTAVEEPKVL